MDPKNTDEASSSSSLPPAHEQDAPADPTAPSSSSLPCAQEQDAPANLTAPSSSSSSLPAADSTLRPTSSSYPVIPDVINCHTCSRQFDDFAVWFEHVMDCHPRNLEEEREERERLCPWCSRSYLAHDDRCCAHVMNARSEEMGSSERICHVCGISLANPEEYKKHVWDVHTPITTICGQVVRRAGAAADHQPSSSSARSRDQASSSTAPVAPWPPSSSSAVAAWSRDQATLESAVPVLHHQEATLESAVPVLHHQEATLESICQDLIEQIMMNMDPISIWNFSLANKTFLKFGKEREEMWKSHYERDFPRRFHVSPPTKWYQHYSNTMAILKRIHEFAAILRSKSAELMAEFWHNSDDVICVQPTEKWSYGYDDVLMSWTYEFELIEYVSLRNIGLFLSPPIAHVMMLMELEGGVRFNVIQMYRLGSTEAGGFYITIIARKSSE